MSQFANPYLACEVCGARVTHTGPGAITVTNQPCGHLIGTRSVCPSWSPVDGCLCIEHLGARDHEYPPQEKYKPPRFYYEDRVPS